MANHTNKPLLQAHVTAAYGSHCCIRTQVLKTFLYGNLPGGAFCWENAIADAAMTLMLMYSMRAAEQRGQLPPPG